MNKIIALSICILIHLFSIKTYSESYVVISYANDQWGTSLIANKIDLDNVNELSSCSIPIYGELITKIPINVRMGGQSIFIIISLNGEICKNCEVSVPTTNYVLLDTSLNIIRTDSIQNIGIYEYLNTRNDSLIFSYFGQINDSSYSAKAAFTLSNRGIISRARAYDFGYSPNNYPRIDNFVNINRIENPFYNIYWDIDDAFNIHFLKINFNRNQIVSSLAAGDFISYSKVFGISPIDSSLYVFSLSYDIPRGPGRLSQRNNRQSYLIKYNVSDFSYIDSIPIPNIGPDSDYIRNELGSLDVIGPFMVYYFFRSDDYRYFSPAMLFIFDTRTNEATWLRVGWR